MKKGAGEWAGGCNGDKMRKVSGVETVFSGWRGERRVIVIG